MTENHPSSDDKLKVAVFALWSRFQETMFARLALVERAIEAGIGNSLNDEQRGEAGNAAHKLAGSLGTFGLGEGSKLAAQLEAMLEGASPFGPEEYRRLGELAKMLRREIERGPSPPAGT
ncbi:MAG TPA: Hpt domain-containing protein [Terriglobia bacterium]|nr:Hpt domain-containing protein [Terriglobia bacterium]